MQLNVQDLENCRGGVYNQAAHDAQVARWNRPVVGGVLFKLDMARDYISGKGYLTGSGSPGIGG
jgi:hypothetical protein